MRLLLVLAAAAPLCAQCSYVLTPAATQLLSIPSDSYTATITVDAPLGCPWTYAADVSWISFSNGPTDSIGSGPGSFTWTAAVDPYPAPNQRQGHIVFYGLQTSFGAVQVTQAAPVCNMALPLTSASFPVPGGTGSFPVQTNCAWSASASAGWMTPTPTSGITGGPVSYTIGANGCVAARSGSITVFSFATSLPSIPFQISQDGSLENLTLAPATLSAPPGASTGRVVVTTGAGCGWSSFSDVSWLHITGATAGSGNGGIGYSIDANPGPVRTGNIRVGAQAFAVTQQAAPPPSVQVSLVVSAASYAQGAVAPGEIVTIGGSNMGPTQGVGLQLSADGLSITKTLGGTQVLFDGVPAALTYVSAVQVNAVVPYSVAGKQSTQVQLLYQGGQSNPLTLSVQAAAPAIFTIDASGAGPGAILNQDYTLNGRFRPAASGSAIQIYCTGAGVTDPASADAALTGTAEPFPRLTQPVTVTIAGVNAQVLYSGGAPTAVAGLTQINALVPSGVAAGPAIPIVVKIGNWQSQAGVTVAIQ